MKTDSEKEKKLSFALNKLKNLNLQNPGLKNNENLTGVVDDQVLKYISKKSLYKF